MSGAVDEITSALIAGGMSPGAAASLVVRASMELSGGVVPPRSAGADRMAEYRNRREAMGLPRIFPANQYQAAIEKRDGRQCIYCRDTENLVIDHIEPLFLGGNDDLGNLGFACRPCNGGKAGKALANSGMQIIVESAHIAHKAYLLSKTDGVNTVRTHAHTSEPVRASISKKKIDRAPASRLSEDWKPSEKDIAYALSKGLHLARVETVAEKFKNHWLSKSKNATSPNWHLRWCTWVMNEIEWSADKGTRNGVPRNPLFEGIT